MTIFNLQEAKLANNIDFEIDDATILDVSIDNDQLAELASGKNVLAIRFEKFNDGRGFSIARILREQLSYDGKLFAIGNLLPDQAEFLLRTGFDFVHLEGNHIDSQYWVDNINNFKQNYQHSTRQTGSLRSQFNEDLAASLNKRLSQIDDIALRLKEISKVIPGKLVLTTSLQKEDQIVLHSIAKTEISADIVTLDTGRIFPEIYDTIAQTETKYGIKIKSVHPRSDLLEELNSNIGVYGFRDSIQNRKNCCYVRKIEPLFRAIKGKSVWLTGLRASQSITRLDMKFAEWDANNGIFKVNPVLDLSDEALDEFIKSNDIPIPSLYEKGYPSIGCQPCTRPIEDGEDIRSGRWWWENPETKECGLHK